ncbi:TetR/AcrR family transcriptional regulator [Hydrogenophaga pseudoflava]|uniref:TetR/AcrR family transcriptional regulator n=1 Tax=Hydrogenophaga pseudoflava TaxID=47421 RepID=UPI0027E43287|nr:helix-turn-helix domain-containing protein [Hydrogenophaga pseudoflava]MDQ7743762.1 helix-turn-helix domain-containing protein [Hydrogenophaga pseudoflava]
MQRPAAAVRRSQAERTDTTRAALIAAARELFLHRGYAATGTPEIVSAAGLTRGALYHHFADKTALFLAVAEQLAQAVADDVARGSAHHDRPVDALLAGAEAYFASMAQPGRARLLLLEAPSVLPPTQVMTLSERAGTQALRDGLAQLLGGTHGPAPLHELTVLLSAAFDRAALAMAQGEAPGPYLEAFRRLFTGLARS